VVTKGDVTMSTGFAGPPLTLWVYGDERGDDPMRKWEPHDSIYVWKKTFSIIYTIKIENKKTFLTRIRSTLPITLDPHVRVE